MTISGSCHCGAIRFEVPAAPTEAVECNCSYCTKSGGLWAYYPPEALTVTGGDGQRVYSQSGYNKHHFCANCGCQTYGISPDWSLDGNHDLERFHVGINVRLLDGLDLAGLAISRIDGRNLW